MEVNYTAFGLKVAGLSSKKLPDLNEGNIDNKNLYNDKELIDDADLDWYDYGFRNYDPQIGRFPQLDPLTDDYPHYTPFQYAGNEPIANVDMDGLEEFNALHVIQEVKIVGHKVAQAASHSSNLVNAIIKGTTTAIANLSPTINNNILINSSIKNLNSERNRNAAHRVLAGDKNDIQIDQNLARRGVLDPDSYMEGYEPFSNIMESILTGLVIESASGRIFGLIGKGGRLILKRSVGKILGKSYKAVSEVTAEIKNTPLLNKLNEASKGDWVKVYEAGIQNGNKIEVHYFRNNTTGKIYDVKIKYNYWHQKPFKKLTI